MTLQIRAKRRQYGIEHSIICDNSFITDARVQSGLVMRAPGEANDDVEAERCCEAASATNAAQNRQNMLVLTRSAAALSPLSSSTATATSIMGGDEHGSGDFLVPPDLQRALANSIMRHDSVDDLRILLASGSKADQPVANGLRPLHYAVYEQYADAVRLLLVRGGDVNTTDSGGYTAMHLCAERGYVAMMRILVEFGGRVSSAEHQRPLAVEAHADADASFPANDMEEPLRLAIKGGHYECAEFLLEHGADPNARYFLGSEINMVHPEDTVFLELLLKAGARPDAYDRSGLTPLMKAAKYRKCLAAVRLLIAHGADVNARATVRQDFRTVLHYAVMGVNLDAVATLVEKGARVKMDVDYDGPSPLDVAILTDDVDVVAALIDAGADINSFTSSIGTPLHVALSGELRHQGAIVELLLRRGADVNMTHRYNNGAALKSPLVEYLNSQKTYSRQVVSLLLRYGARVIFTQPALDPRGLLRSLGSIVADDGEADDEELLELLAYSSECFDIAYVQRSMLLPEEVRVPLLRMCTRPTPLRHLARLALREMSPDGEEYVQKVRALPFPRLWIRYLLFEFC
ncbi:PREDICTED: ankyrin-1-like [Priapulus caudatus]|uniref:Ankyrin-1-like n=1 Tax=Priapulus caudatus TaxID=37621 RepID=A0ABM1EWW5_PRICU|nr:PREDICTED: ankyrin-1-like [Priapulus caudatus]